MLKNSNSLTFSNMELLASQWDCIPCDMFIAAEANLCIPYETSMPVIVFPIILSITFGGRSERGKWSSKETRTIWKGLFDSQNEISCFFRACFLSFGNFGHILRHCCMLYRMSLLLALAIRYSLVLRNYNKAFYKSSSSHIAIGPSSHIQTIQ